MLFSRVTDPNSIEFKSLFAVGCVVLGWLLGFMKDRSSQKTLFDHRLRLEKEYSLYVELWEKLFSLRQDLGQLVGSIDSPPSSKSDGLLYAGFNDYQSVMRKGEPFMSTTVLDPAREVSRLAREMIRNHGKLKSIAVADVLNLATRTAQSNDARRDEVECLEDENESTFETIELLFKQVSQAIRHRVSVP